MIPAVEAARLQLCDRTSGHFIRNKSQFRWPIFATGSPGQMQNAPIWHALSACQDQAEGRACPQREGVGTRTEYGLASRARRAGYERRPLSCTLSQNQGRNDMRASQTGFAIALLATVAAAGMASAQQSYPCTETNANLSN